MALRRGYVAVLLALLAALLAGSVQATAQAWTAVLPIPELPSVAAKALYVSAVVLAAYGAYELVLSVIARGDFDKRRRLELRTTVRLVLVVVASVAVLAVITNQWAGALVSLGVGGVVVAVALQQPLLSVLGWTYVMVKQPYRVGDRVEIAGVRGDVVNVDPLVTTLWEVNGGLVTSNQPSGRVVTVPNNVVLGNSVANFSAEDFEYVWTEVSVQLAYETDLAYAMETAREAADAELGDEMERAIERYRRRMDRTPVDLDVHDRPSVNLVQRETWVELRVRMLVQARRSQRRKNAVYERILAAFTDDADRVQFPVGRNR